MKAFVIAAFLLVCLTSGIHSEDKLFCHQAKCMECARDDHTKNEEVECTFKSIVTEERFLPNTPYAYTAGNSTNNDTINSQFVCAQFLSYNASYAGDNLDIIRGCVRVEDKEKLCNKFKEIEKNKDKKDSKCEFCDSSKCNSSSNITFSITAFIFTISAIIKSFY